MATKGMEGVREETLPDDGNIKPRPLDDEVELIERARLGDGEATGDLFVIHAHSVRRLLQSVVGPGADLDDLGQEVFIQVHRSISNYRGDSAFSTWLHRLTVNTAISHLRTLSRKHRPTEPFTLAEGLAQLGPGVEETAAGREMVRRLYEILDLLPRKRRVAFTLFDLEGRSLEELAQILDISRAAAKSRVWFARREVIRRAGEDPCLGPFIEELRK